MPSRKILVTGATGKQGGAVVKALLASNSTSNTDEGDFTILALTRHTESQSAKKLAENPKVELIQGDLDHTGSIFEKAGETGSIWGVFLVTLPALGKKDAVEVEAKQGYNLVDASVAYGVKHFVFSSVDRGGVESDSSPTPVPHFISKHNIEKHLKESAKGTGMTYTILRPTAFMENLTPNLFGRVFAAMWMGMGSKPLQLVATKDIGVFAALAFKGCKEDTYKNQAIGLAGDELTQEQGSEKFWKAMGRSMPRAYGFWGSLLQTMIKEVGVMFGWFKDVGYGADVEECRRLNPGMLDLEMWLKEESGFKR